jgi:hypothetical protein
MDEPRDRDSEAANNPQEPEAGTFEAAPEANAPEQNRWWENQGGGGEVH